MLHCGYFTDYLTLLFKDVILDFDLMLQTMTDPLGKNDNKRISLTILTHSAHFQVRLFVLRPAPVTGLPDSQDRLRKWQSCSYKWWMFCWLEQTDEWQVRGFPQMSAPGDKRKDQQNLPWLFAQGSHHSLFNKFRAGILL